MPCCHLYWFLSCAVYSQFFELLHLRNPNSSRNANTRYWMSNHIKDAAIAIRHLRGYIISILQDPEIETKGRRLGWRATASGHSLGASFTGVGLPGSCASSRLDHGLKFYGIRGGCAGSRLIYGFLDCNEGKD